MHLTHIPSLLLAFQDGAAADTAADAPVETTEIVTAAAETSGLPGWALFLIVVALLVLPFVIGQTIANLLRLRDLGFKLGITLFALTLGLTPFVSQLAAGNRVSDALNWGIDLAGGTNMVFQVDHQAAADLEKVVDPTAMEKLVGAVSRRVNPGGTEEVTVRQVGRDRIEVIIPGADAEKVSQVKKRITNLGSLEFALLANQYEHAALIQEARALPQNVDELRRGDKLRAKWRHAGSDPTKEGETKPIGTEFGVATRTATRDGKEVQQFLVVVDEDSKRRITGQLLKRAYEEIGPSGAPVVGFEFNTQGAYLFQQLTARHMPKEGQGYKTRLAILLNDEIHSAPSINDMIPGRGIIEGDFDSQELQELIDVLNAGALDVPLHRNPISEFTVSPLLGLDVQTKGLRAIMWATIMVFVVTLAYYLVAGAVADICLALNIILLMGSMALIDATFTLPGLAGLALAIGMAVDANVLIFERIREEQERGSSLRMSIHNGFSKALSAIVDSNVTTLITAMVLYILGTEQVKGFAVTLFIGLIWNMFCAIYVARMIFDIAERKRWLKQIRMFSLIKAGNIDFVGMQKFGIAASLALMVLGIGALVYRGADNLDIDFRGGAMVTFRFEGDQPDVDQVRAELAEEFQSSITLEQLQLSADDEREGTLFRMRTIEKDEELVGERIKAAFEGSPFTLVQQSLQHGEIATLPAEAEGTEAAASPFPGGLRTELQLSQPVQASTIADDIATHLQGVAQTANSGKYLDAADLIEVTPVEGEATSKTQAFVLQASSAVDPADLDAALATLQQEFQREPAFEEKTTFDSAIAQDTQINALLAIALSNIAIIFYLWFRFQRATFGIAAVIAVVHDITIVLGLVAIGALLSGTAVGPLLMLMDFKIDLALVAAFMTIIGYSLNDTIVVFDRVREVRGKNPNITNDMINLSLNQTLSRTLLTSTTTLIVLSILYVVGGEGVHGFSYSIFLGIIVGTFSSIFVACPALVWLSNRTQAVPKQRQLARV